MQFIKLTLKLLSLTLLLSSLASAQTQKDIIGPAGSGAFGTEVVVLPNGNIVITDPEYDAPGPINNVGAVYLYNGETGALISTLTGSSAEDRVGLGGTPGGITLLSNGNYVVSSILWDGSAKNVGAITWGDSTIGVSGIVSDGNSLVGSTSNDRLGFSNQGNGVTALTNGNYVVSSKNWDNNGITDAGAVTFCNGTTGTVGTITATNSLIGSTANDQVGREPAQALPSGNYVVATDKWDNGDFTDAGAVTFGNGKTGIAGTVSDANSLVGSPTGGNASRRGIFFYTDQWELRYSQLKVRNFR